MNMKDPLVRALFYVAIAVAILYLLQHTRILQDLLGLSQVG